MSSEWTVLGAFLVGLAGTVHCIGMCGGIAGVLSSGMPTQSPKRRVFIVLGYNVGRVASYTLAGAISGGIGETVFSVVGRNAAHVIAGVVSALFLIALGAYLAGWWSYITILERAGARIWRYIEPIGRRLLPVRSLLHALLLGGIWGWLPCGMVYTVLVWSMATGNAMDGAFLMLGFGLGTLPTLFALGGLGSWLQWIRRDGWARNGAAIFVIILGVYGLWTTFFSSGHIHHH